MPWYSYFDTSFRIFQKYTFSFKAFSSPDKKCYFFKKNFPWKTTVKSLVSLQKKIWNSFCFHIPGIQTFQKTTRNASMVQKRHIL